MGTEDQRNSGYRGPEDQRNSGYRGPEEQRVQRTIGTIGTEDQRNIGLRGPKEQRTGGTEDQWNRQQFISVNNSDSDPLQITCGVPQGSVLGPVLFLIYMNDFTNCSSIFDFHLFADDTNLFHTYSGLQHLEQNVNRELSEISLWLCAI